MIIVRLQGGMGNQMFQYALGRALSIKNKTELKLDTSFFDLNLIGVTKRIYGLDVFNIKADLAKKSDIPITYRNSLFNYFFSRFMKNKGKENSFNFDSKIFDLGKDVYLDGYFQSPKYFAGYEDIIIKDFSLKNPLPQNIQEIAKDISNMESLCLHVRRGDFVGNKHHEVVGNDYYKNGIDYVSKNKKIDKIYIFSDDIKWCEDNLKFDFPIVFVGDEYLGMKDTGHLFLMSQCKNFVISNSSFSWWAVWLSNNKDKIVVAPKNWFPDTSIDTSDLIPNEWIRL